jgi:hypothetical protein
MQQEGRVPPRDIDTARLLYYYFSKHHLDANIHKHACITPYEHKTQLYPYDCYEHTSRERV